MSCCDLLLCQRCKDRIHLKIASAEDHTIIDIKDIHKHQTGPKTDLTRIKCGKHAAKICCFYCKTCEQLVCQTCVTESHNKHEFTDIRNEYEIRIKKIQDKQIKVKEKQNLINFHTQKLNQVKSNEQSNYEKVKQELLEDEKSWIEEIKKETTKLIKELDQKRDETSSFIDSETKQLEKEQKEIQEQEIEINKLLQTDNVKGVFSDSNFKSEEITMTPYKRSFKGIPKFIPGDKTKRIPGVGKLDDVTIEINPYPQNISQFETELNSIFSMECNLDGSVWISDHSLEKFQKLKPFGDNIQVITNINMKVLNIAVLLSGDLLISVWGSSNLKLVPLESKEVRNSDFTVPSLQPIGIHVTKDNKIFVGAIEKGPEFPVRGQGKVVVMDYSGCEENSFQYDRNHQPLFSVPLAITSGTNGYIAIVDQVSKDFEGRVVVLDQNWEVRNIYAGHPDVNNYNMPFKPQDITTTPLDNLVVTDPDNHTLHLLNNEGEIITFYNMKDFGILRPMTLSFSTVGELYIGSAIEPGSKEKAELSKIDNFLL